MADIDMIPQRYRDAVRLRRTLRLAGAALACVALLGIAGSAALRWRSAAIERQATLLEAATDRAQASDARDAVLQAARMRQLRDDATLRALRGRGEFDALARGLEAALTQEVWLTELTLERDIQGTPAKDGAAAAGQQALQVAGTVQLKGQASDYAAVTAFLAALARQPGIGALRLVASSASAEGQAIDFQAAGMLTPPTTTTP